MLPGLGHSITLTSEDTNGLEGKTSRDQTKWFRSEPKVMHRDAKNSFAKSASSYSPHFFLDSCSLKQTCLHYRASLVSYSTESRSGGERKSEGKDGRVRKGGKTGDRIRPKDERSVRCGAEQQDRGDGRNNVLNVEKWKIKWWGTVDTINNTCWQMTNDGSWKTSSSGDSSFFFLSSKGICWFFRESLTYMIVSTTKKLILVLNKRMEFIFLCGRRGGGVCRKVCQRFSAVLPSGLTITSKSKIFTISFYLVKLRCRFNVTYYKITRYANRHKMIKRKRKKILLSLKNL